MNKITSAEIKTALTLNEFLTPLRQRDRVIAVIGDNEPMSWTRVGVNPQVKVMRESQFAAEWPVHAAENTDTHIWISASVTATLPDLVTQSVTHERTI